MCVWTKKRGSMNAVVLMATPCPKSLHGKGEKWIARNILQGLDSVTVTSRLTDKKTKKYKGESDTKSLNKNSGILETILTRFSRISFLRDP